MSYVTIDLFQRECFPWKNLACHFFLCSLEWRQWCLESCRENSLFKKKYFGNHKDKIPTCPKAFIKRLSVRNCRSLGLIFYILLQRFLSLVLWPSRLESVISKGFTVLPDEWFSFFIKSAKCYMLHSNFTMGRGRALLIKAIQIQ